MKTLYESEDWIEGATAWHSHPVGQTLFCLSGAGRVQRDGEQVQEIRAGDTAIIPPDTRHWHGSAPDKLFSHLAMYAVLPPFGRKIYSFEDRSWGSLD